MKRVAVIAAALAIAGCKGKEASLDTLPKMSGAAAADTTKKMDTAMKMSDTGMKKAAPAGAMAAAAPTAAPAAAPAGAMGSAPATTTTPTPVIHEMAMAGSTETFKGVVKSVNYQTRHITVTNPMGVSHSFMVPPSVPDLDKVVKGDQVSATFVEAIAVYLAPKGQPSGAASMSSMTVSPTGMPNVEHVQVTEFTATVTAINAGTRTLTVTGPQGNSVKVHVDPSVQSFSSVKVGDHIVVRASEAVAVQILKQ
jgi:hypothetical protein